MLNMAWEILPIGEEMKSGRAGRHGVAEVRPAGGCFRTNHIGLWLLSSAMAISDVSKRS
jgi:hypothetical protein